MIDNELRPLGATKRSWQEAQRISKLLEPRDLLLVAPVTGWLSWNNPVSCYFLNNKIIRQLRLEHGSKLTIFAKEVRDNPLLTNPSNQLLLAVALYYDTYKK